MVFAPDSYREPSGQFYHDMTNPAHLSGLTHLDNFIVTRKSCLLTGPDSYRDLQKRMPTPTQTATHTTGPSDCLITKIKSPRIDYLMNCSDRLPKDKKRST